MPRGVVKVAGAPIKTRWTVSQNHSGVLISSPQSPTAAPNSLTTTSGREKEAVTIMQQQYANGGYSSGRSSSGMEQNGMALPRYESFDGSQYSVATGMARQSEFIANGYHETGDYLYGTTMEERASQGLGIDTRTRTPSQNLDPVGHHLLYENAMVETQSYEILDIAKVDELKKERTRLITRLEAAKRKLLLESKVKDAAQNLQRLYSVNGKSRPDTPQSPDSPKQGRKSLLGSSRNRTGSNGSMGGTLDRAEDELAMSIKKVDELNEQIKTLLDRRQYVESTLLRHTAAVLAEQTTRASQKISRAAMSNGGRGMDVYDEEDEDDLNEWSPDEFDGIRTFLSNGGAISGKNLRKGAGARKLQEDHEQQLADVQNRLEQLNDQMRNVIVEASRTRGKDPLPELDLHDDDEDPALRLEQRFGRLESNLKALRQEQEDARMQHNSELESLRQQHDAAVLQHQAELESLRQEQEAVLTQHQSELDSVRQEHEVALMQHQAELDMARERGEKENGHVQKLNEYEATLSGLWDIIQTGAPSRRPSMMADRDMEEPTSPAAPLTPLKEDFSLQAFSAHVQHLFDRTQSAKEQQDILRRQIQQQRELNGKSDAEKDSQLADLQTRHDQLAQEHAAAQEEATRVMGLHTAAEREASEAKLELVNIMNDYQGLKKAVDEKDARHNELSAQLESVSAAREAAEKQHQDLESEFVRLTTELTMAKAELDGAYGSRAERAKEAQAADLAGLTEQHETVKTRAQQLEQELSEMTADFQELTRESVQLEKERGQLEDLIDGLRERVDGLEGQLHDEKARWLGVRSPSVGSEAGGGAVGGVREPTSLMVLRQEFKRMMRESRAEGVKALRAEQEQRRLLEAELRRLRQANGPLALKAGLVGSTASVSSAAVGASGTDGGAGTTSVSASAV
ncbi:Up-regulated During Septation [Teratosphaeria destructans]|uniref:Up-regulated During Septation n=1 Tax=Teratosphaeria destructans TaxID=418781 RepID=A0A9W7SY32_9PEZI|nr:Up-regulated During Septation [Teratosphaeria destructans]